MVYDRAMRNAYLVGTKVYLRPLEEADAAESHRWLNDPDVRRTLAARAGPYTEAMSREWIRALDFRRAIGFAIVAREDDVHVGNCDLRDINPVDRNASLGIVVGRKDRWGMGYGTEAVALLCRHAFDGLALHKVWLSCYANNPRGLRLYARLGFREEGRRREQVFVDGAWIDDVLLGLLRDELRSR
jgi:RimJ/RimL family protein N-acetyltransferase